MRVTVLGGAAACPNPGQGSSSYLVEHDGSYLLLDCGPGTLPVLRQQVDFRRIGGIVISHVHSDHTLDLVPYRYGLRYGPGGSGPPIPLWLPPEGTEFLARLAAVFALGAEGADTFFSAVFDVREYDPGTPLRSGPFVVHFQQTIHAIPCWAMRIEAGGRTLVYLADTGPDDRLVPFARGADLAICEGTLSNDEASAAGAIHLSPAQAGAFVGAAGVPRLLLTHLWAEFGYEAQRQAAAETFGGPVEVAVPGLSLEV